MNPVVDAYSRLARVYDDRRNIESCWGRVTAHATQFVELKASHQVVVDVGCGTGRELARLAASVPGISFVGVEPAAAMREIAVDRNVGHPNVRILDGAFETLPLETDAVDYIYSNLAFHWTTNPRQSVVEMARVLRTGGDVDLMFVGRHNGREFIRQTTPVFFKYLTPKQMLEAASRRQQ